MQTKKTDIFEVNLDNTFVVKTYDKLIIDVMTPPASANERPTKDVNNGVYQITPNNAIKDLNGNSVGNVNDGYFYNRKYEVNGTDYSTDMIGVINCGDLIKEEVYSISGNNITFNNTAIANIVKNHYEKTFSNDIKYEYNIYTIKDNNDNSVSTIYNIDGIEYIINTTFIKDKLSTINSWFSSNSNNIDLLKANIKSLYDDEYNVLWNIVCSNISLLSHEMVRYMGYNFSNKSYTDKLELNSKIKNNLSGNNYYITHPNDDASIDPENNIIINEYNVLDWKMKDDYKVGNVCFMIYDIINYYLKEVKKYLSLYDELDTIPIELKEIENYLIKYKKEVGLQYFDDKELNKIINDMKNINTYLKTISERIDNNA